MLSPLGKSHSSQLSKSPKAVRFEATLSDEEAEVKPQRTSVPNKKTQPVVQEEGSVSFGQVDASDPQPANDKQVQERPRTQDQELRKNKHLQRLVSMTSQNLVTVGYNADVS